MQEHGSVVTVDFILRQRYHVSNMKSENTKVIPVTSSFTLITLVDVYVDLVVFTRIAGTS